MYCEYLLSEILEHHEVSVINEFYLANLSIGFKFAQAFGVPDFEKDDFMQLCYFGYRDAITAYRKGSFSFLSFFRRCTMHRYYEYKLEMRYPLHATRGVWLELQEKEKSFIRIEDGEDFSSLDNELFNLEQKDLIEHFWGIVEQQVNAEEFTLLRLRYVQELKFQEVGDKLGISSQQARAKHSWALKKLRRSQKLKRIAEEFFF